jgi:hypothetical protein
MRLEGGGTEMFDETRAGEGDRKNKKQKET